MLTRDQLSIIEGEAALKLQQMQEQSLRERFERRMDELVVAINKGKDIGRSPLLVSMMEDSLALNCMIYKMLYSNSNH